MRKIAPYEICQAPFHSGIPYDHPIVTGADLQLQQLQSHSTSNVHDDSISITSRQDCFTGAAEMLQRCAALRGQAIDVLAAPLGGDKLAAEYLLLQLVSRYKNYYAAAYMQASAPSYVLLDGC